MLYLCHSSCRSRRVSRGLAHRPRIYRTAPEKGMTVLSIELLPPSSPRILSTQTPTTFTQQSNYRKPITVPFREGWLVPSAMDAVAKSMISQPQRALHDQNHQITILDLKQILKKCFRTFPYKWPVSKMRWRAYGSVWGSLSPPQPPRLSSGAQPRMVVADRPCL